MLCLKLDLQPVFPPILFLQEGTFKQTSHVDQLAIHFSLEGNMIHKDSDEARRQKAKYGASESKY